MPVINLRNLCKFFLVLGAVVAVAFACTKIGRAEPVNAPASANLSAADRSVGLPAAANGSTVPSTCPHNWYLVPSPAGGEGMNRLFD
ncbi:MAG: hypothetical protein M3014_01530, partial [Chloroflexota bacterium]|nr:hypothetical protein [Chloroflexota bacterium]